MTDSPCPDYSICLAEGTDLNLLAYYLNGLRSEQAVDTDAAAAMERFGVGTAGPNRCLIAKSPEGEILGYLFFSTIFSPSSLSPTIVMMDLHVQESCRRFGIGRALMTQLSTFGLDSGCTRIDWQVPRLDLETRAFFEMVAPDSFRLNDLTYRLTVL